MKILFVRFANRNELDGHNILDNRLLDQLLAEGIEVEVISCPQRKSLRLPLWASAINSATVNRVVEARRSGIKIVVSHEGLFQITQHSPVDALIVHNYFKRFVFRDRPLVERYFSSGSSAFYRMAFDAARCVFFISHREHRLALADFPALSGRSDICIPPPRPTPRLQRSDEVLHLSGTDGWHPKKLSRLTQDDLRKLTSAGYQIRDLDAPVAPGFAIINDRFEVGFKLKLAQMLHSRDVIASFADLYDEIENICPGNPFYRQAETVEEAISFFREIAEVHRPDEIDSYFASLESEDFLPNWRDFATALINLIKRQSELAGGASNG